MKTFYLFFIVTFLSVNLAKANIIRDSEIEEAINLIIEPLRANSGLKDLKIFIIEDAVPNAFTIGDNEIGITSGLIIDFPDPDVLRGLVAHEIGHILGHHEARRDEIVDNYKNATLGTASLGLATAISKVAGPEAEIAGGGMHFAERSIFAYKSGQEIEADQTALALLEKSSHSGVGLIKFFEKIDLQLLRDSFNQYDQTHPVSNQRLLMLKSFVKRSKFVLSQNSLDIINKYKRSAAKLAAFTYEISKIFDCKFEDDSNEINCYMRAIKCFRIGNFEDSINHINSLIMKYPNDAYYHELKAQIYFEAGKSAALNEYEMAEKSRPDDLLIRLGKAVTAITLYKNDIRISRYYKDLSYVLEKEPENLLALYYMKIYYEKNGLKGKSYLNSAIIAYKSGHIEDAEKNAQMALDALPKNSAEWKRAGDILEATK